MGSGRRTQSLHSIESLEARTLLSAYYVSASSGLDSGPGTLGQPFRTIQEAANVAQPGNTVFIMAGVYHETVTPANSGTAGAPITYEAYNGASVTIDGADPIAGWTPVPGFTSPIYEANQPWDLGMGENELFFDGVMMTEARWPNTVVGDVSHPTLAVTTGGSSSTDSGQATGTIDDPKLTQPAGYWVGATIHIAPGQGWFAQTGTVTSSAPGTLSFSYYADSSYQLPTAGNKYYLTGQLQDLDSPGEWYRDPSTGTLYFWAPGGINPGTPGNTVEAKHRDYAFDLSGLSHINITGINVFGAAITSDSTSGNLSLSHLNIQYAAQFRELTEGTEEMESQSAVLLQGNDDQFLDNTIAYTAGHGLFLQGSGDLVSGNTIHDIDYDGGNGAPINIQGSDQTVTYNTIYNTARNGIRVSRTTASFVMHNLVYDIGLQTTDVGAIYAYETNGGGTEIAYNIVHDAETGGYGGVGLFLDNGDSNYILDHNISYNCNYASKFNFPSDDNTILNNTLVAPVAVSSNGTHEMVGTVFENNIFVGSTVFGPQATVAHNLSTSEGSAGFVAPYATPGNFQLAAGSPAINAGAVIPPYTNGYAGSAPDDGAYESGVAVWTAGSSGGSPTPTPTVPTPTPTTPTPTPTTPTPTPTAPTPTPTAPTPTPTAPTPTPTTPTPTPVGTPNPTPVPLPTGTLGASIAGALPAAVVGGAKVKATASVTVSVPASKALTAPATVTLYISPAPSFTGSTQVGLPISVKIKAGRSKTFRVRLSAFPAVPDGTYYLLAAVKDPDGSVTGVAGPTLKIAAPFVTTAVAAVRPLPATGIPGKRAGLAMTLTDTGNVPASGTVTLTVLGNVTGGATQTLAALPLRVKLKPDVPHAYRVKFTLPAGLPAGTYDLTASLGVSALGDNTADGTAASTIPLVLV